MAKARILEQLGDKKPDIAAALERILEDPRQVAELIEALQSEKGSVKYACEKVLRLAGARRPELLYPYFDVFVALLDCDNSFLKWGAMSKFAALEFADAQVPPVLAAQIPGPCTVRQSLDRHSLSCVRATVGSAIVWPVWPAPRAASPPPACRRESSTSSRA